MRLQARSVQPRPVRVTFHTLGCPKNLVDSDSLKGVLQAAGFECVRQPSRADVLIVNTCGFVDDAKIESLETLAAAVQWKAGRPGRRVLVMGCLTQDAAADVAAGVPGLDGVFGIGQWTRMLEALGANPVVAGDARVPLTKCSAVAGPASAYLRIADGCSQACAFCSVPQMRGFYRSEPMSALLREARLLTERGVREIILVGQETTSYGVDLYGRREIVSLCRALADMDGVHWIRLLYAHPPTTPPALLDELVRVPKLLPYLDYPIEHGSDRMLERMNRRTTAARMREAIATFRAARPDACVRTTVLLGFPGETDEDFEILCRFLEDVKFERAGAFVYSPQEGTAGAEMAGRVEEGIALDRLDRIMRMQRQICREKHHGLVGSEIEVLVETSGGDVSWGRSAWDAPEIDARVRVAAAVPPGQILRTVVTDAQAYRLDVRPLTAERSPARREICVDSALPSF